MSFRINCPECDEPLSVSEESAGKKVRCKKCDTVFRVPSDDDSERSKASRRSERDEDESPRRRRREEDEEGDERPRRKAGHKSSRKAARKNEKKPITALYIVGVILAGLFLVGAIGFLGWRAGVIGSRNADVKDKTVVEEKGEPKYLAPDARIGETRKEITGPDGERAAAAERVKLSMDLRPLADGAAEVVLHYEVLVGADMPRANRLVVMETNGMHVLDVDPVVSADDLKKGTFTFQLSAETRQKTKKLWVALITGKADDVKKNGLRVSNVITLP
jgi:hypothetical protein